MAEGSIDLNKIPSPAGPFPEFPRVLHKPDGSTKLVADEKEKAAALKDGWSVNHTPVEDRAAALATDAEKKHK